MLLKRHHIGVQTDNGSVEFRLKYVELKHTGVKPEQNFSTSLIAQGMADGWISMDDKSITLGVKPEALKYSIKRKPGYYCCHDGKAIPVTAEAYGDPALAAVQCQQYLKANGFAGKKSPDPSNPAGYERTHAYECVLDAKQHEKFKAKQGAMAMSMKQGV